MSRENLEVVRQALDAWQRRGIEGLMEFFAPEIMYIPLEEGGAAAHGSEGFRAATERWLEAWEDYAVEVRGVREADEQVVVPRRVSGRAKASGIVTEMDIYDLVRLRQGKAIRWQQFADEAQALEAARLRE